MALREPPPLDKAMLAPDALKGRIALVTGGGSGLGFETAKAFARCGADVGVFGRTLEKAEAAAAAIAAECGVRAVGASADVRRQDEVAAAFDVVQGALGPISILANNAGANFPGLSGDLSGNAFGAIVRIALDGTFIASREFYRRFKDAGLTEGAILNNGAQYMFQGFPGAAPSCAAKCGVSSLTQSLAAEWAGDGIRVNSIAAGFFPHEGSVTAKPDEADEKVGTRIAAGRTGRIRELGWAAAYLCSPYAGFVTGLNLFMDGGEHLRRKTAGFDYTPPSQREWLWA